VEVKQNILTDMEIKVIKHSSQHPSPHIKVLYSGPHGANKAKEV